MRPVRPKRGAKHPTKRAESMLAVSDGCATPTDNRAKTVPTKENAQLPLRLHPVPRPAKGIAKSELRGRVVHSTACWISGGAYLTPCRGVCKARQNIGSTPARVCQVGLMPAGQSWSQVVLTDGLPACLVLSGKP